MKKQSVLSALLKSGGYTLLFVLCQFAASFIASIALSFRGAFLSLSPEDLYEALEQALNANIYEIMLLSALFFFGALALLLRRSTLAKTSFRKTSVLSCVSAVFLGFGAYAVANILLSFTAFIPAVQASQEAYMQEYEQMLSYGTSFPMELLYVCVAGPIVEEILCRGVILNTLKKSIWEPAAILISALIFALIHGNLYQIVFTLPLGILMGFVAVKTRSVIPAIFLHMAFNFTNYPMQLGVDLFGEESSATYAIFFGVLLFCLFSIPVGILLFRRAVQKMPPLSVGAPTAFASPNFTDQEGDRMAAPEYLVVGLGNPGEKYTSTRHNCGFMAMDYIALREGVSLKNLRFQALCAESVIQGKKVLLMKPQTYMNLSGKSVREAAAFYKIPPERILVIFDDINFAAGEKRIRKSGSAGGHNGIKSIIECLGSEAFPRVKVGVGTPMPGWDLMHWVLATPPKEDLDRIISSMEDVYGAVKLFVADDLERAMALYNGKTV